ncbi:MAG: hypothetical protein RL645_560 [Actinomycetota bacterium]|jgi:hypothetical protein
MSEEQKFTSRRELRDAERAGLVQAEELAFDGVPRVENVSVPVESTGQPLTRRQLRELEKTGGVLAIHTSQIQLPELPQAEEPVSQEPAVVEELDTISVPFVAPDVIGAEREEPMTVSNPVVAQVPVAEAVIAQPESRMPSPSPDAARKALADAAEFEAILAGAVQGGAANESGKRRTLIVVTAVLALLVGGLAIAASALGILK